MPDLIDRQAAIDALCELMHHWFGGDPNDEIREIKRELEKLPSAQQDSKETSPTHKALDTISRQAAIRIVDGIDTWQAGWRSDAIESMKALPPAQPETHEERTETHACDLISRQAAISLPAKPREDRYFQTQSLDDAYDYGWYDLQRCIEKLPSAQPEIVRCGQCKYAEVADAQDNQDGYTCQFHRGSIWFSGSYCSWGERKSDEQV